MTGASAPAAELAIVVVNYGSHELIRRNLGGLDLAALRARVIVVDNFSGAAEREAVRRLAADRGWHLIARADNPGFGDAVNAGVRAADGCATVLVLNPDVMIEPRVVTALHEHSLRDPLAMITPRLLTPATEIAFAGSQVFLDTGRIKRLPPPADERGGEAVSERDLGAGRPARAWLPATCVVMQRDQFLRVGGFDPAYFLYWEDVDLSFRWVDAGGSLVIRHDLAVVHHEGGTQERRGSRALSATYYRWNCRNRLLFAAHNLDAGQLIRWIAHTPSESWQILLRGGRRQLLRSPQPVVAVLGGSLAGLTVAVLSLLRGGSRG